MKKTVNQINIFVGALALVSTVACAQQEDLGEVGHDTQTIVSDILGVGFYTGPDLKIEMKDGDENPVRVVQQQVTFSPPPAATTWATPDGKDATPWHTHPGWVVIQVLEGQLTLETEVRCETYDAGEVFIEYPNELNRVVNTNDGQSKTHATHISGSDHPPGAAHEPPANGGACGF